MWFDRNSAALLGAAAMAGMVLTSSEARAWHFGEPHQGFRSHQEDVLVERRAYPSRYHYEREEFRRRPRHHEHCREVPFHDRHGRHRITTTCD